KRRHCCVKSLIGLTFPFNILVPPFSSVRSICPFVPRKKPMRRALLPLLLLAALLCPTAARAVDNPLEAIPDSAGLLMRFQSPRPTIVKWIEFLKTVDPKLAQQADQMKS